MVTRRIFLCGSQPGSESTFDFFPEKSHGDTRVGTIMFYFAVVMRHEKPREASVSIFLDFPAKEASITTRIKTSKKGRSV